MKKVNTLTGTLFLIWLFGSPILGIFLYSQINYLNLLIFILLTYIILGFAGYYLAKKFTDKDKKLIEYDEGIKPKVDSLAFRFTSENLHDQVTNYSSLKLSKSARGECVLFFGTVNIISLAISGFADIAGVTFIGALFGCIIYAIFLLFIYKGHRWAIICLMVLWTGDKILTMNYQISIGTTPVSSFIFLFIGLAICSRALQVENLRRKQTGLKNTI